MRTVTYTGVIERGENGFGVFFPDLPGCVSAGRDLHEAMKNGEEALSAHIGLMLDDGDDIPEPSADTQVDDDIDVMGLYLARAQLPGKSVRLNITMDEGLIERIDRVARNRSAFLAEAARDRLARELAT